MVEKKIEINQQLPILSMNAAVELTGLTERQIRYYEQRELIVVDKTKGGQRKFSLNNLNQLIRIQKMIEDGETIKDIRRILNKQTISFSSKRQQQIKNLEAEFLKIGRLN